MPPNGVLLEAAGLRVDESVRITATGAKGTLRRTGHLPRRLELRRRAAPDGAAFPHLGTAVMTLCLLVLDLGLLRGRSLELMLLTALGLAVPAVPESLPVMVTLSLALRRAE